MPFDRINLMNLFFAHKFQPHFQPKWANPCSMKFQFSKQMRCIMEHNVLSVSKIEIELELHGNALLLARVFRRKFHIKFGQKWHLIAYFKQKSEIIRCSNDVFMASGDSRVLLRSCPNGNHTRRGHHQVQTAQKILSDCKCSLARLLYVLLRNESIATWMSYFETSRMLFIEFLG